MAFGNNVASSENHYLLSDIDHELACSISFGHAKRFFLLPFRHNDIWLEVLVTKDTDPYVIDEYRATSPDPVRPVLVSKKEYLHALREVYEDGHPNLEAEEILGGMPLSSLVNEIADRDDLLESEDDAPIIQLVNSLIVEAIAKQASDIHIEPAEKDIIIRFRVDGILHNILQPPKPVQAPLMSRIKVMAGLNIAEKRLPQDGSIRVQVGQKDVDVRVSVLPTSHGERIVLRLLRKDKNLAGFSSLGLTEKQTGWFNDLLDRSYGIVLVTGPTGSGKSTTLYTALRKISTPEKNIITVEDPIEYTLPGVGQIQVNPKIGLTFAKGLRSILRQDPDVIMIGEIRDFETAEIAIQASLTGHLVMSTLHTNDSVGAITRLLDIGVEPFLVGSSLEGIVAQRLVRLLCEHCKTAYEPSTDIFEQLAVPNIDLDNAQFHRPTGCPSCMGTGYKGRIAIFEMLTITDSIRELIDRRVPEYKIRVEARQEGLLLLRESGLEKAVNGVTSLAEVCRVTQELHEAGNGSI